MTAPNGQNGTSRRATLQKARQSRRPSRLGAAAGASTEPDRVLAPKAGFPGLLVAAWEQATAAATIDEAVEVLLTLGGHVPADVQLLALRLADECALAVLHGRQWRDHGVPAHPAEDDTSGHRPFLGELGLTTSGRVVLRVPSQRALAEEEDLVGEVLRVPWSARALTDYREVMSRATVRAARAVADCRADLAKAGPDGRAQLLDDLRNAARRTAPFVLYQDGKRYTNFRERNNLTGKTLWPGHPDCVFSSLRELPLELWSDNDAVMVVCLTLLVRSAGYARIEEVNGTQLTLDHVAELLDRTRQRYSDASRTPPIPPASDARVSSLHTLAGDLRERRGGLTAVVQLYREIHGPLMHKIERVAGPWADEAMRREALICAHLSERLPLTGSTLRELGDSVAAEPGWLAKPYEGFGTGLESVVHETVRAALQAFDADFAMSRGLRSLTALVQALRDEDWPRITRWDLPEFFCCVVPNADAREYFGGSFGQLADIAWSMAARMQYNSWHFLAGNLPPVPEVVARDYFVPPVIPDIAYFSDQHHHGHVAARVRFSIRSPQAVTILDRRFGGFVDLRLLRCDGTPFNEQDLLAAHSASAFIARATGLAAELVQAGEHIDVTAFDPSWHGATIAGQTPPVDGRTGVGAGSDREDVADRRHDRTANPMGDRVAALRD